MFRLITPIILALSFILWIGYRVFIKRDFKKQAHTFYGGLFFFGIWGLIYWLILK